MTERKPRVTTRFAGRILGNEFFAWYNDEHRHSGIAYLTPSDVHEGRAEAALAARHEVMSEAYRANPSRFTSGPPKRTTLADAVYINPPLASSPPASSSSPPKTERSEVGATMTGRAATPPTSDSEPWGEGAPVH